MLQVVLEATDGDEAAAAFAGALQTHIEDETSVLRAGVGEIHLGKSRPPSAVEIVEPARLQEVGPASGPEWERTASDGWMHVRTEPSSAPAPGCLLVTSKIERGAHFW